MTMAHTVAVPQAGWLRSREFDLVFICGITGAALGAAGLITIAPTAVELVWLVDAWFLGYPHVVATFVRLAPDKAGLQRHRFLMFGLPLIVIGATSILALGFGIALIATVYFYWQWYHTLRQSWGISQLYRRRSAVEVREPPKVTEWLFMLVALWGLLHWMSGDLDYFLDPSLPLYVPKIPVWIPDAVGVIAVAGLAWWAACRFHEWRAGELPLAHTLFSASHFMIFISGYIVMDDIVGGWIVTNIWHTAQYLMIVWLFNQNVAAKAPQAAGWYFRLTRNNSGALFFTLCLMTSLALYLTVLTPSVWWPALLVATVIANQSINFHHFIVDAVIWRRRRSPAGLPA